MPLAPLKPDPVLSEQDVSAPGSVENMLDQAVWLARMNEALRAADEAVTAEVKRINANYRAAQSEQPKRAPRATDPDYLDGDYEMVGSIQSSDWGD